MQQNFEPKNLPPDAAALLRKNGIDPGAVKSGDVKKVMNGMRPEDAQKLNQVLNDKEALEKLLHSKQAQEIMNRLFGNNGAK